MVQNRFAFALVLLLSASLVGIGGADFWLKERPRLAQQQEDILPEDGQPIAEDDAPNDGQATSSMDAVSSSSSSRRAVKKGQSAKKRQARGVDAAFGALGLQQQQTREISLLHVTSPTSVTVNTVVLLQENDRAMLFAWLDSNDAKTIFATLKESLQATFSTQVRDVTDQTLAPPDGAVTDVLSFIDPALSSEKIIFGRTRTRVYEIHVTRGKEELATKLIAELAK